MYADGGRDETAAVHGGVVNKSRAAGQRASVETTGKFGTETQTLHVS